MFRVLESAIIEYPPAQVFNVAANPHKQLEWDHKTLRSVEKLTRGPLGGGARYRGDFRGFGMVEFAFQEYEPAQRFAQHAVTRIGDVRYIFEGRAMIEGTGLTQSMVVKPKGMWKLVTPIMRVMLRRRLRNMALEIRQYLDRLPP